ncbi:MAG: hypothetical protein QOE77_1153 [Blastocatellia bacterium]|nr:hypothetical protein [Blastocatellia bacterium]
MQAATKLLGLPLSEWESIAKTLGFFAAAVFFIYKAISGYLITNMAVKLDFNRQRSANDMDYLVVTASLSKGDRGSVNIHDAQGRLRYDGSEPPPVPLIGVERLSYKTVTLNDEEQKQIDWDKRSESSPFIRLSPGEEAEFACCWEVPSKAACKVEVVFIGKRLTGKRLGQWRSSGVSLPILEKSDLPNNRA